MHIGCTSAIDEKCEESERKKWWEMITKTNFQETADVDKSNDSCYVIFFRRFWNKTCASKMCSVSDEFQTNAAENERSGVT